MFSVDLCHNSFTWSRLVTSHACSCFAAKNRNGWMPNICLLRTTYTWRDRDFLMLLMALPDKDIFRIQVKDYNFFIDLNIPHKFWAVPYLPNTIQQDIHPNIWLAGNSPAGYSAGTILLPITQKIRHYGKDESYLTQWHTRGFQNIKLISLYSKSVNRENSKCLHFASVQMKHIV